ncbi:hypothetical protein CERZMDRAFT_100856 [Cercospora zeae-maydis SCOH1-5]|uniref:F-box domain-containing protein n=1 Tax=Cercospora zeae-maydis SCOH1-5 TaxID=717836 RepID=A0A6A6F8F7_9PEZI|nr:hypothetical protein CERZMDRAFT_100856 [Cercospora zeae-maydis SCOH1-5]
MARPMTQTDAAAQVVGISQGAINQDAAINQGATTGMHSKGEDEQIKHLQGLPNEVIGNIAAHLGADLHALRLACKDLLYGSQDEWNFRHMRFFSIALVPGRIQQAKSVFVPAECLSAVKSLCFSVPRYEQLVTSYSNEDRAIDTFGLLEEFLHGCTTVQSVSVHNCLRRQFEGPLPPCPSLPLLRALRDNRPRALKTFVLHTGFYPVSLVFELLESMEVNLRFLTIQAINFTDGPADTLLAFIRDRLNLRELHINSWAHIVDFKSKEAFLGGFAPGRREHKWLRDELSRKREHYTMGHAWLEAMGLRAIKLAINRIFQIDGNDLYDASMTQEALGF